MSSRKDQKAALREERLKREQEAAAAERRRRLIGYVVGGALAVAALIAIGFVLFAGGDDGGGGSGKAEKGYPSGSVPEQRVTDLQEAVRAADCELSDPRIEGNNHVETTVRYRSNPPTSGDHNQIPAEDGAVAEAPRSENYVHSLEHGRILIQFRPNASDQVRGALKALFDEDPAHMLLFPNNTRMEPEVAATAWGHLLACPRYNDRVPDAIRAFKTTYRDRGPEFVP